MRREWCKLIQTSDLFDEEWYCTEYPDVNLSGLSPEEHYFCVGDKLSRDPGAKFDIGFYRNNYEIKHPSGHPFLDYLDALDRNDRPVTKPMLLEYVHNVEKLSSETWGTVRSEKVISYCIPIKDRLEDLQGTLRVNLTENIKFKSQIEFLILLFDDNPESENWIKSEFVEEIECGYLRVLREQNALDSWHFGKAKNSFRPHIEGRYYSSLDGDNFVAAEETKALLELVENFPFGFVFHHFSGNWGDGTSGRVTLPTSVYRSVGYDSTLLPRQFDELDLILGALKRFPFLPLVCSNLERNVLNQSKNFYEFWTREMLPNRCVIVPVPESRKPLNPRGANYAEETTYLKHMNNFNAALSAVRRAQDSEYKNHYLSRLNYHKHHLLDTLPQENSLDIFFEPCESFASPLVQHHEVSLFTCVRNEEAFLPKFVDHYRKLGVTRFFIVDDHSEVPIEKLCLGCDVDVFRPKVGDFQSSKTLWLESLMRVFVPEGNWVLAADADEFLHLPDPHPDLCSLSHFLKERNRDFCLGLLLDLVPDPKRNVKYDVAFDELLTVFCDFPEPIAPSYRTHPVIEWGFEQNSNLSWRFDLRYHAFETIDCLRKIPFFRLRNGRHLNQGFHTFHSTTYQAERPLTEWGNGPILPIFHYKLAKVFSEKKRKEMLKISKGYHSRTARNINEIFENPAEDIMRKISHLSRWMRPVSDAHRNDIFDSVGISSN